MIRDLYCCACGHVILDHWCNGRSLRAKLLCPTCGYITQHTAVCNGGIKARYRLNDWPTDPDFYKGQVKALGVEAVDSDGNAVQRYHSGTRTVGAPMHDNPKYHNGSDVREDKRDRLHHASRRRRGKLPIVCDLKG